MQYMLPRKGKTWRLTFKLEITTSVKTPGAVQVRTIPQMPTPAQNWNAKQCSDYLSLCSTEIVLMRYSCIAEIVVIRFY